MGIGASNLRWDHWLVPVLPIVALWTAQGVLAAARGVAQRIERERPTRWALTVSLVALLLLTLSQPAFTSLRRAYQNAQPNTQVLAIQWFASHVAAQTVVGSEWYTGLFWSKTITLEEVSSLGNLVITHKSSEI